jgi:hypothetical protein
MTNNFIPCHIHHHHHHHHRNLSEYSEEWEDLEELVEDFLDDVSLEPDVQVEVKLVEEGQYNTDIQEEDDDDLETDETSRGR